MILDIGQQMGKGDVMLRLFDEGYTDELAKIAADTRIWQYMPESLHEPAKFKEKWINKTIIHIKDHKRVCFIVFHKGQMAGSSSYYQIDIENKKLTIGYTWLHPNFWGTIVNLIIKLIMLKYAFEVLTFNRVEFSVDVLNSPSRQALSKFGIQQEGILRNRLVLSNGRIRDSAIYSIINTEWPKIKANLQRLAGLT